MTEQAALAAEHGLAVRGQTYPIVLPSVRDPRLHLAAVIISLQILGQVAFDFRLSIAQILISIGTCAVLELWIVLRRQHALVWPASALLTGNGVAFVLRVPGTEHGDWWSTQGWWIFAGTAAVALLSKYVIRFRGSHVFNPSNFGLVLCFLLLGPGRVEPLDFWWGPMSPALALALAIIVVGGFAILSRLALVGLAVSFWIVFAGVAAVVAATGHAITARWHLGPVEGLHLWTILAFSPEILVFLFFMLTDPRTVPAGSRQRVRFGVAVALVAALLVAASSTEFWAKVGVLGALTIVCAVRPLAAVVTSSIRPSRLVLAALLIAVAAGVRGRAPGGRVDHVAPQPSTVVRPTTQPTKVPRIVIRPSKGVDSMLDRPSAVQIAADLQRRRPAMTLRRVTVWLEARRDQFPAVVAILEWPSSRQFVEVALRLDGYRIARDPRAAIGVPAHHRVASEHGRHAGPVRIGTLDGAAAACEDRHVPSSNASPRERRRTVRTVVIALVAVVAIAVGALVGALAASGGSSESSASEQEMQHNADLWAIDQHREELPQGDVEEGHRPDDEPVGARTRP